jgi:transketolase
LTTALDETKVDPQLAEKAVNTIRFLAVDAVQKANAGHPGAPMGMAPLAFALWTRHMKYNPKNPKWFNRDRFVLSNGHASMLIYAMLHLTGYDVPLEQLKQFRQWDSITAGHPEFGLTPGVETTTGPLGQGFANAVGMALAGKFLAATYNQPGHEIIDNTIWVTAGDGCMQEGVAQEAASIAGHLELDNLICFYDDNKISIEGNTVIAFTEDVGLRFEAYGWHVAHISDINNLEEVGRVIEEVKKVKGKPKFVVTRSIIGYGSPNKANTGGIHGEPLGKDEVKLTKENLGWQLEPDFYIPDDVLAYYRQAIERGAKFQGEWNAKWEAYKSDYPEMAKQLEQALNFELPTDWERDLPKWAEGEAAVATRDASFKVLNAIAPYLPNFIGGSADLAGSTKTSLTKFGSFEPSDAKKGSYTGRTLHYGIREHAMGAVVNGATLYGGVRIYGATFLCFLDYMRPAVRLAALMGIPSIFVYTHDSIGQGEDGPTHQPIEHLAIMRATPNLSMIRPADPNETAYAWKALLENTHQPSCIVLTRQKVPVIAGAKYAGAENLYKGAYILSEASSTPKLILIASGSEVSVCLKAQEQLEAKGVPTRVVSMPSWDLFEKQDETYKIQVFPPEITARLAVESASPFGWETYVGKAGAVLGINHFGASAPGDVVLREFGFTPETVAEIGEKLVSSPAEGRALARKITNTHPLGHH